MDQGHAETERMADLGMGDAELFILARPATERRVPLSRRPNAAPAIAESIIVSAGRHATSSGDPTSSQLRGSSFEGLVEAPWGTTLGMGENGLVL